MTFVDAIGVPHSATNNTKKQTIAIPPSSTTANSKQKTGTRCRGETGKSLSATVQHVKAAAAKKKTTTVTASKKPQKSVGTTKTAKKETRKLPTSTQPVRQAKNAVGKRPGNVQKIPVLNAPAGSTNKRCNNSNKQNSNNVSNNEKKKSNPLSVSLAGVKGSGAAKLAPSRRAREEDDAITTKTSHCALHDDPVVGDTFCICNEQARMRQDSVVLVLYGQTTHADAEKRRVEWLDLRRTLENLENEGYVDGCFVVRDTEYYYSKVITAENIVGNSKVRRGFEMEITTYDILLRVARRKKAECVARGYTGVGGEETSVEDEQQKHHQDDHDDAAVGNAQFFDGHLSDDADDSRCSSQYDKDSVVTSDESDDDRNGDGAGQFNDIIRRMERGKGGQDKNGEAGDVVCDEDGAEDGGDDNNDGDDQSDDEDPEAVDSDSDDDDSTCEEFIVRKTKKAKRQVDIPKVCVEDDDDELLLLGGKDEKKQGARSSAGKNSNKTKKKGVASGGGGGQTEKARTRAQRRYYFSFYCQTKPTLPVVDICEVKNLELFLPGTYKFLSKINGFHSEKSIKISTKEVDCIHFSMISAEAAKCPARRVEGNDRYNAVKVKQLNKKVDEFLVGKREVILQSLES